MLETRRRNRKVKERVDQVLRYWTVMILTEMIIRMRKIILMRRKTHKNKIRTPKMMDRMTMMMVIGEEVNNTVKVNLKKECRWLRQS